MANPTNETKTTGPGAGTVVTRGASSTCIDNLKPCLAQIKGEEEEVEGGEGRRGAPCLFLPRRHRARSLSNQGWLADDQPGRRWLVHRSWFVRGLGRTRNNWAELWGTRIWIHLMSDCWRARNFHSCRWRRRTGGGYAKAIAHLHTTTLSVASFGTLYPYIRTSEPVSMWSHVLEQVSVASAMVLHLDHLEQL